MKEARSFDKLNSIGWCSHGILAGEFSVQFLVLTGKFNPYGRLHLHGPNILPHVTYDRKYAENVHSD